MSKIMFILREVIKPHSSGKVMTQIYRYPTSRFWCRTQDLPNGCKVWIGGVGKGGYGSVKIGGKGRPAHRVAYELLVGDIPEGMVLDHICHNRLCVNVCHLRVSTIPENSRNATTRSDNTSGYKGVTFHKKAKKWMAQIKHEGARVYLGCFESPKEAYAAYCEAAARLHGEFANFGRAQ